MENKAYKELSRYMSENGTREASVFKCMNEKEFRVSVKNESGSSFASTFNSLDAAENFAEDWILL
jgi:hypothetical protein